MHELVLVIDREQRVVGALAPDGCGARRCARRGAEGPGAVRRVHRKIVGEHRDLPAQRLEELAGEGLGLGGAEEVCATDGADHERATREERDRQAIFLKKVCEVFGSVTRRRDGVQHATRCEQELGPGLDRDVRDLEVPGAGRQTGHRVRPAPGYPTRSRRASACQRSKRCADPVRVRPVRARPETWAGRRRAPSRRPDRRGRRSAPVPRPRRRRCGRSSTAPLGALHRQDRDALDAERLGRALRRVGQEQVLRVVAHLTHLETRALDRRPVVVLLASRLRCTTPTGSRHTRLPR